MAVRALEADQRPTIEDARRKAQELRDRIKELRALASEFPGEIGAADFPRLNTSIIELAEVIKQDLLSTGGSELKLENVSRDLDDLIDLIDAASVPRSE